MKKVSSTYDKKTTSMDSQQLGLPEQNQHNDNNSLHVSNIKMLLLLYYRYLDDRCLWSHCMVQRIYIWARLLFILLCGSIVPCDTMRTSSQGASAQICSTLVL